jgi:pre-mRNA-splicing factor CWC22
MSRIRTIYIACNSNFCLALNLNYIRALHFSTFFVSTSFYFTYYLTHKKEKIITSKVINMISRSKSPSSSNDIIEQKQETTKKKPATSLDESLSKRASDRDEREEGTNGNNLRRFRGSDGIRSASAAAPERVYDGKEQRKNEHERGADERKMKSSRAGGAYVPPFKLAQMMREIKDTASEDYQKMTWEALKKSINGLVNKINASNVKNIVPELFSENLVRGRGLFARSVMKSQMASPQFSMVFASLVAVTNTKFPELGELVVKRVVLQFRRAFKRNDKAVCVAATKFLAAMVNQQVCRVLYFYIF